MTNYWKHEGIPHKGWTLKDVIDVCEEGHSEFSNEYENCMMCGNENIRYVHIVHHVEIEIELRVGCRCSEKMTEDYQNPKRREKELRNKGNRLINWKKKKWKIGPHGGAYLSYKGYFFLIYQQKSPSKFRLKIGKEILTKTFDTIEDAKNEAFNYIERF
jgi:hypothetical protein